MCIRDSYGIAGVGGFGQGGVGEGNGGGPRPPTHQPVGGTGHGVLLGDHDRDPPHERCDAARHAGIAAQRHDHPRAGPAQDAEG